MNDLEYLYKCGGTRRYHNRPELDQNTAKHSWGVALIISLTHPNPSPNLLKAALIHDSHEFRFSDILSPVKVAFPEAAELDRKCQDLFWSELKYTDFPNLTDEEKLWLDYADVYECCLFTQNINEDVYVYSLEKSRVLWQQLEDLGFRK